MAAKKDSKKEAKKKKPFNRYKMYSVSGDKLERKNKLCPKCGKDSYLAAHKDRLTCGKCGYVETIAKKE
ncbi:MAG: 30S ribosomal protein S27ae [Nanoarchaeota archaeon]|nr:30S ribosomal protein S27ae [Nanoarchaeota archaeon]